MGGATLAYGWQSRLWAIDISPGTMKLDGYVSIVRASWESYGQGIWCDPL